MSALLKTTNANIFASVRENPPDTIERALRIAEHGNPDGCWVRCINCPGCSSVEPRPHEESCDIVAAIDALPDLRDQIAKLADERATFAALVRKLEAVHADPCYQLESLMVHGGRCVEPTYTRELEAARAILATATEAR